MKRRSVVRRYEAVRPKRLRYVHKAIGWLDEWLLWHRWYWLCCWLSADWWGWEHDHWEYEHE
jgi:hypothetical protein